MDGRPPTSPSCCVSLSVSASSSSSTEGSSISSASFFRRTSPLWTLLQSVSADSTGTMFWRTVWSRQWNLCTAAGQQVVQHNQSGSTGTSNFHNETFSWLIKSLQILSRTSVKSPCVQFLGFVLLTGCHGVERHSEWRTLWAMTTSTYRGSREANVLFAAAWLSTTKSDLQAEKALTLNKFLQQ